MKALGLVLVVAAAGCGAAREEPRAAPAAPPATTPATAAVVAPPPATGPIAIARGLDLYEAAHGSPFVGHVDEGEVLDWRDDGFVRVRVGDKELAGYPSPLLRKPGSGIGLYASRDVPLRAEDGSVVATALRGAFVRVRHIEASRVEVVVGDAKVFSAERAGLATAHVAPEARRARGRVVENVEAAIVVGRVRAGNAECRDAVEVLDDGRIAVVHDGIEIVGKPEDVSGCRPRVVRHDHHGGEADVPAGYVRLGAVRVTAFAKKRSFWRERTGACASEVFTPGPRGGTLVSTEPLASAFGDADPARGWTATYADELRGAKPLLTKPTRLDLEGLPTVYRDPHGKVGKPPGLGEGIALCGSPSWLVVGQVEEGVQLLAGMDEDTIAYRPEDVTVWYTSAEACARAVARRVELAKRDPLAAARPSVGCGH